MIRAKITENNFQLFWTNHLTNTCNSKNRHLISSVNKIWIITKLFANYSSFNHSD